MTLLRLAATSGAVLIATLGSPSIADVISDWNTAATPPPPELKEATVDPSTTALLFLDIMKDNCTRRPRCVAAVPNMKRLHDEARAKNMVVWYSLVGSNGKATPDDIMDAAIRPRSGEWYRQSGPDKFMGSTLEPTLRQAGIKTVIICGNSFQGRDRRHGFRCGAARLQGDRTGRLLGGRRRLSRTIRGVPSGQWRPRDHHQQHHDDAQ
jgi:hypothetical protein